VQLGGAEGRVVEPGTGGRAGSERKGRRVQAACRVVAGWAEGAGPLLEVVGEAVAVGVDAGRVAAQALFDAVGKPVGIRSRSGPASGELPVRSPAATRNVPSGPQGSSGAARRGGSCYLPAGST